MFKLALLFYIIVAPTVMGALVTVTLVVESLYNGVGIAAAAALGAVLAAPISWMIVRAMKAERRVAMN